MYMVRNVMLIKKNVNESNTRRLANVVCYFLEFNCRCLNNLYKWKIFKMYQLSWVSQVFLAVFILNFYMSLSFRTRCETTTVISDIFNKIILFCRTFRRRPASMAIFNSKPHVMLLQSKIVNQTYYGLFRTLSNIKGIVFQGNS